MSTNLTLRSALLCLVGFLTASILFFYRGVALTTLGAEVSLDCVAQTQTATRTEYLKTVETVYVNAPVASTPLEPIVMTLVLLGDTIGHEGSIAIKSALIQTSRPLHFHLICSPENIRFLQEKFALFDRPMYDVEVTYYQVDVGMVRARSQRAGVSNAGIGGAGSGHVGGDGGWSLLSKVFIHELLVDVERVIFMDSDMIFVVDPLELWNDFSKFDDQQLMSFPTMGPNSHPGKICSCIMLMDLQRMRDAHFMPSTLFPSSTKSLASSAFFQGANAGIPSPTIPGKFTPFDPLAPFFGDQGIYHVVWYFYPQRFRTLSHRWDVNFCRQHWGLRLGAWGEDSEEDMTAEEIIRFQKTARKGEDKERLLEGSADEDKVISPGILHFNCQPGAGDDVWLYEQNHSGGSHFGAMVTTALRYKWAWLSKGTGTVKSKVIRDLRWWDEHSEVVRRSHRRRL